MSDTQLKFAGGVAASAVPAACGCELHGFAVKLCPLHAAAPDLLAACVNTLDALLDRDQVWVYSTREGIDLRAAIATAKGETNER